MNKMYETRNKFIKRFTILVIVFFVISIGWIAVISLFPASAQPTKKEIQEVQNQWNNVTWSLVETWINR